MNIGSLENRPLTAHTVAVSTPSAVADGEKGQKQKEQPAVSTDTVEISDEAKSMYAKMKARSDETGNVQEGAASENGEESAASAAEKTSDEKPAEKAEEGQDAAAAAKISPEDLKKKIDKLKQQLKTLTAKANGDGNPNVENEIRQLKAKLASYKAQESAA